MAEQTEKRRVSGVAVKGISRRYGKKEVLKNVTFSAAPGSIVGITGINGSGKSTLLSILAGVRKPSGGTFLCYGHDMFRERSFFGRMTGYVPQENPLIDELTAAENLKLWYGAGDVRELAVTEALQLSGFLDRKAGRLSGGMKRRLAIACAVSGDQPVLLMDEPSSSLDLQQREFIRQYIHRYTSIGGIVIMSTHDPVEIGYCTDLYYMQGGIAVRKNAEEVIRFLMEGRK